MNPQPSAGNSENSAPTTAARVLRRCAAIAYVLLLAGYFIFNRTFARIGFPPVYVGEMVLGLALLAALFDFKTVFIAPLQRSRAMQLIAFFMLYGAARLAVDAPSRGLDAARDSVLCLYAAAAFLAPWLFAALGPGRRKFLVRFLVPVSLVSLAYNFAVVNGWVGAFRDVKVDFLALSSAVAMSVFFGQSLKTAASRRTGSKAAAILAPAFFVVLTLVSVVLLMERMPTRALWPAPVVCLAIFAFAGGFVRRRALIFAAVLLFCFGTAGAIVSQFPSAREKVEALADPEETHFATRPGQIAAHSVKWRLIFWRRCAEETLRRAPFFGLGFGTNLTDLMRGTPDWPMFADSQNAAKYGSPNRNPHSAHVTVFTRLGLLGLAAWLSILAVFFTQGLRNCRMQSERYRSAPAGCAQAEYAQFIAGTTLLSVWSIYLLAMSFGVVLENPFGGIWFWTLTGVLISRNECRLKITQTTTCVSQAAAAHVFS